MDYLGWILLLVGCIMLLQSACELAKDARGGFEVSMGGAMQFSTHWLIASALVSAGMVRLLAVAWWWGIAVFLATYCIKFPAYRLIVARNLGTGLSVGSKDEH